MVASEMTLTQVSAPAHGSWAAGCQSFIPNACYLLPRTRTTDPKPPVGLTAVFVRSSAKGDNGISIGRVRYMQKTGRWRASRFWTTLCSVQAGGPAP